MIPKLLRFHSIHRFAAILFIAFCTILISMASMSTATNAAPNGQSSANGHYYSVHTGDTLSGIAQFYGFSAEELMYANGLSSVNHIHSGDRLYIPARPARYGQSCRHYHWVQRGQTLSWVAVHHDIDVYALAQANNIYDHDHVEIGSSLCIPAGGSSYVVQPVVRRQPPAKRARPVYQQPSTPVPPTATPYVPPAPTMNPLDYYPEPNGYVYYTLRFGDTLRSLAAHYRTSEHHLSVLNPGAVVAPGITWVFPLYGDVSMPPTSTPLFYPTITSMPPTATALFYPTLTPRPPTVTPLPTATRRPTATALPTATRRPTATPRILPPTRVPPAPVPPVVVEINIAPSITQQGFSIETSGTTSQVTIATATGSIATSTARATTSSGGTSTAVSTPGTPTPAPPTATPDFAGVVSPWVGQYYVGSDLGGSSLYENHNSDINFNWGTGGPGYGLPNDKFSVRWMTHEQLEAGRYTFRAYVEGGIRLYVDGKLLINKWHDNSGNFAAEIDLEEGYHTVQVDYGKIGSTAHIRVWWTKK